MERLIIVAVGGTIVALMAGLTYMIMGKTNDEDDNRVETKRRTRSDSTSTNYSSLILEEVRVLFSTLRV